MSCINSLISFQLFIKSVFGGINHSQYPSTYYQYWFEYIFNLSVSLPTVTNYTKIIPSQTQKYKFIFFNLAKCKLKKMVYRSSPLMTSKRNEFCNYQDQLNSIHQINKFKSMQSHCTNLVLSG